MFEDGELKAVAEQVWHAIVAASGWPVDEFVVLPNHVHGIMWIGEADVAGAQQRHRPRRGIPTFEEQRPTSEEPVGAVAAPLPCVAPGSLGALVRAFKSATAKRINNVRGTPGGRVWQRNYYERVIRDDGELNAVRQYIWDNPLRWAEDPENRANRP